jgi:hypothetical protein
VSGAALNSSALSRLLVELLLMSMEMRDACKCSIEL